MCDRSRDFQGRMPVVQATVNQLGVQTRLHNLRTTADACADDFEK
jgi:hypothetical protein